MGRIAHDPQRRLDKKRRRRAALEQAKAKQRADRIKAKKSAAQGQRSRKKHK